LGLSLAFPLSSFSQTIPLPPVTEDEGGETVYGPVIDGQDLGPGGEIGIYLGGTGSFGIFKDIRTGKLGVRINGDSENWWNLVLPTPWKIPFVSSIGPFRKLIKTFSLVNENEIGGKSRDLELRIEIGVKRQIRWNTCTPGGNCASSFSQPLGTVARFSLWDPETGEELGQYNYIEVGLWGHSLVNGSTLLNIASANTLNFGREEFNGHILNRQLRFQIKGKFSPVEILEKMGIIESPREFWKKFYIQCNHQNTLGRPGGQYYTSTSCGLEFNVTKRANLFIGYGRDRLDIYGLNNLLIERQVNQGLQFGVSINLTVFSKLNCGFLGKVIGTRKESECK